MLKKQELQKNLAYNRTIDNSNPAELSSYAPPRRISKRAGLSTRRRYTNWKWEVFVATTRVQKLVVIPILLNPAALVRLRIFGEVAHYKVFSVLKKMRKQLMN